MIKVNRGRAEVNGDIFTLMAEATVVARAVADCIKEIDIEEMREKLLKTLSDDVIDAIYLSKEELIKRHVEQIVEGLSNVLKNESPEES